MEGLVRIITLVLITLYFRIEQLADYSEDQKEKQITGHVWRIMWLKVGSMADCHI